jgi:hypothetical protein
MNPSSIGRDPVSNFKALPENVRTRMLRIFRASGLCAVDLNPNPTRENSYLQEFIP